MTLEIVDQDGSILIRKENEQHIPSIGDEIWVKECWYKITDKTFFYREEGTSVHMWAQLVGGA